MGVYIKGMKMPKDHERLIKIYPNGDVTEKISSFGVGAYANPAVEITEPHGRLIDADRLVNRLVFHTAITSDVKEAIEDLISEAPTIIEGSDT